MRNVIGGGAELDRLFGILSVSRLLPVLIPAMKDVWNSHKEVSK